MLPSTKPFFLPEWLIYWIQHSLLPALGLRPLDMVFSLLRGVFDTLLLVLLGVGLATGGNLYMESQYTLPRSTQATVLKWAPYADYIARQTDIPREVPLVIWFKENSMQAVNPELCTGIMGAYDLVRSGQYPCFTPGPISDIEVSRQLAIGAVEFKKRCPDINYWTQDPNLIKRCYFAYNAGAGVASRLDPTQSAYVMNNYNENYQNMTYSDIELGTVQVTSLGAWPAHLAIQSLIISSWDVDETSVQMNLPTISTRLYDWVNKEVRELSQVIPTGAVDMTFPEERLLDEAYCLSKPHVIGRPSLRPSFNPVTESPMLTQDIHGCHYGLPGLDITSDNDVAILQAPIPGQLTTYTDQWHNSTIRIENDEWIVWLLHSRSYLIKEGRVQQGEAVGVMGSVGYSTGPHVHYSVYDKINQTFVDPRLFLP